MDNIALRRGRCGLSLVLLVTLALAACGPIAAPAAANRTSKAVKTPTPAITSTPRSLLGTTAEALRGVQVEVWHAWFGPEAALLEAQIAEFNSGNSWGITIHAASQGDYSSLFDNVTAALESDERPDVVVAFPEHALAWSTSDAVVDLDDYVRDPLWGFSESDLADFPAAFLAQDRVGDKRLGMPAQRSARFLLYNQTWGRELGFDSPPTTADEFRAQACAANQAMRSDEDPKNDGQGGWIVDTHAMTALSWLLAFDGGPLKEGNYRFLTPNNITALKYVKKLHEDGCAWVSSEATPRDSFAARAGLFATGSLEELPDQMRAFASAGSADEWTVLPFPGVDKKVFVFYGTSYILLRSTPAEQLASWLFIRWMLSPENQVRWAQSTDLFPLRLSARSSLVDYRHSHPQWEAAVALMPSGQTQPQMASWRTVRIMIGDGFAHVFRVDIPSGQVAAVLAQMDSTVGGLSK